MNVGSRSVAESMVCNIVARNITQPIHVIAHEIYTAHVKPLENALATAQSMCRTAHDVARAAWGGEIPSPLPGHTHSTEEEMLADYERMNCPWCGGSGHVDDCNDAGRIAKAKLAKAEADKAVLVEALEGMVEIAEMTIGWSGTPEGADGPLVKARAALSSVKEENCG